MLQRRVRAAWSAVTGVIGLDECLIYLAIGLVTAGCWQVWRPGAYLFPGAVMLWMYLPTRAPFVQAPSEPVSRRRVN